ncbi:MAG: response regulator transcription factor, partial [Actinobacteria bacterium]|nr:response regulator transcription factor [Actinomycetota bacterium]
DPQGLRKIHRYRQSMKTLTETPRVFVADDNELILKMLDRLLSLEFEIVGQAADGPSAVDAVLDSDPDVVVLDYMMPGGDGIETARSIRAHRPDQAIVLYTAFLDGDVEDRARNAGISQCVEKVEGPLALERAIRRVSGGLF